MAKKANVGGQAVIEGVMMRGCKGIATAVRTTDGKINVDFKDTVPFTKRNKLFGLPIIRGFVSLVESLVVGIQTLNYSASFFEEEEETEEKSLFEKIFKEKSNDVIMGFSLMFSLVFSILIFFILPTFVANIFKRNGANTVVLNIAEGIIRVAIFILYIFLIGKMEDIKRVFQYHGAEHKTIFCYEHDEELTPENALRFTRLHPRCGTNFLFLVMIVSIIVFSLTGWNSLIQRIAYRVVLLPIVSGVTYELIKWMGKSDSKLSKILSYPGLKLQELTTKDPDLEQLEVAIVALKAAEGLEYESIINKSNSDESTKTPEETAFVESCISEVDYTIGELLNKAYEVLKKEDIASYQLDAQLLLAKVINKNKLYVVTNREEVIDRKEAVQYFSFIEKRKNKMPVKYITEECEFMGNDLYVKEGVLIPRPDTEILVEEVIKKISSKKYTEVCDLCCGSGAIGVSVALDFQDINVDFIDISETAEEVTNRNIEKFDLQDRTTFILSDLLEEAISKNKKYDAIISNPPYIKSEVIPTLMEDVKNYEPYIALSGGDDGLHFYREITEQSLKCLKDNGMLAFEIGYDQKADIEQIMTSHGFVGIYCLKDLADNDRVLIGFRP